ncbi:MULTISPECIES: hypothetical protein [Aeromonas]|uniref:hypothetical protein n=1 Tax=Aeromonas hydrophila TaxID=644 RepID=UPI0028D936D7|nr:hypothetical protein [Aeromonas dhakensis]
MYEFTGSSIKSIPEKIFNGVRFIHREGNDNLVVSFSAFTSFGQTQKYNYINNISSQNALLSFLDSNIPEKDPRGTYYLDFIGDDLLSYIRSIGHIINDIADKNNIHKDNIYLIGSSKGAVGAILCAFVCGYDNVIVNAPQFRIGSYVKRRSVEILNFMLSKHDMYFLDTIILNTITNSEFNPKNIMITCGIDDLYHLKEVEMYESAFVSKKILYKKVIFSGGHDDVSIVNYREKITKIIP